MTQILLEKTLGGLSPASSEAYEVLGKIPAGTQLMVDVKDPRHRSVQQHRYWFALLNLAFDNVEAVKVHFGTVDNFRAALLIKLGYSETFRMKDGNVTIPASVSFAKMSPEAFAMLVEATKAFFETELGLPRDQLEAA